MSKRILQLAGNVAEVYEVMVPFRALWRRGTRGSRTREDAARLGSAAAGGRPRLQWWRIVRTALAAFLVSMFASMMVVVAYALVLGFEARGAPDPTKIKAFAGEVAPVAGPLLLLATTALLVYKTTRNVAPPALHGLLSGAVAAVFGLDRHGRRACET